VNLTCHLRFAIATLLLINCSLILKSHAQGLPTPVRGSQDSEDLSLIGPNPKMKNKLKIIFLGDSITEAGVSPKGYVTLIKDSLKSRHVDKEIEIIGAGISGHKVPDLQKRLERDVLAHKPNLVVIYIGINDVWHSQSGKGTAPEAFEAGLKEIIDRIHQTGSRVILCTPSMIGEKTDGSNPLDKMLEEYSEISRRVARETAVTPLDLRKRFVHELKTLNGENKASGILTSDGVHLNDAGNAFVKECMLPMIEGVLFGREVTHVVMFKFKAEVSAADINRACDAFAELPKKIPGISEFKAGSDISPENLAQGFTHCYILKFPDLSARDAYLVHPAHQEFVQLVVPLVETPLVVDFWER
jgi:lysophospholipase L1-like esterase